MSEDKFIMDPQKKAEEEKKNKKEFDKIKDKKLEIMEKRVDKNTKE